MVKYRSKVVRGYGKESGDFSKKGSQWINFWLLISIFLFFVGVVIASAKTVPLFLAIFGLLGLLSIWTTPMLFIVALYKGTLGAGLPDLSTFIKNKIKKRG